MLNCLPHQTQGYLVKTFSKPLAFNKRKFITVAYSMGAEIVGAPILHVLLIQSFVEKGWSHVSVDFYNQLRNNLCN